MSPFIHLVADYGESDPAFSEVVHRLRYEDPAVTVQTTEITPFSTVATGFWIEQLGLHNPAFDDLLVYSNTAPRTEATTPGRADEGGPLCYLELDTGVPVVAVDAGYNLSFVRDHVDGLWEVDTPASGGQFRSRDVFPERVMALASGEMASLGEPRSIAEIPPPPDRTVCHVDGYGNVKTSIRSSTFEPDGDEVAVEIGAESRTLRVADGLSSVEEGQLAMVPGSAGGDDPYVEIVRRGGAADAVFDHPRSGDGLAIID